MTARAVAKRLAVSVAATLVALLVAEALLRIFHPQTGSMTWMCRDSRYEFFHRPYHRQTFPFSGTRRVMKVRTNAMGLRNGYYDLAAATNAAASNVLLLGDSFTFGLGVNVEETFGFRLQRMLRDGFGEDWNVVNAGVIGWGTDHETLFGLDHLDLFRPRVVVITYCGNDPADNRRVRQGGFDIEMSFLPDLPAKIFLRKHSHLYRCLYNRLYFMKYGEQLNIPTFDRASEYELTEEEWDDSRRIIRDFHGQYTNAIPGGILLVQTSQAWDARFREGLAKLDNGRDLLLVDNYVDALALRPEDRFLSYDGHWTPTMHGVSATNLFRVISRALPSRS